MEYIPNLREDDLNLNELANVLLKICHVKENKNDQSIILNI